MGKFKVIKECIECGKVIEISMTFEQYVAWKYKKDLVQNIFPELNKELREVLISGICPECWEKMFGKGENYVG